MPFDRYTYESFKNAKRRCLPGNRWARWYYARGIRFLYVSFAQFLADVGPRPPGKSLDRINSDSNYEPGNCRWASRLEQSMNQKNTGSVMRYVGSEC